MIYDTKPGCIDVDLAAEAGGNIKSKITVELSIENMQIGYTFLHFCIFQLRPQPSILFQQFVKVASFYAWN